MRTSPYLNNRISILLFSLLIFIKLLINPHWGYDEYGAVITYIELDDPAVKAVYSEYFSHLIQNGNKLDWLKDFFLYLFVVPLRWTYALGLSPWLNFARISAVNWEYLRVFLLFPYLLLSILGLVLVQRSIRSNKTASFYFVALILLSLPFTHWILTFTSYSYHLFCFGLLLNAYLKTQNNACGKYFNFSSVANSLVVLFNYQYLVIVFIFGVSNFIENPKDFFTKSRYKNWVMPFIFCLSSVIFLLLRSVISGKHTSPAYAALPDKIEGDYNFLNHISGVNQALDFLILSFFDVINYFFELRLSLFFGILITIFLILIIIKSYISNKNKLIIKFSILFIIGQYILYLSGVVPLSPTRHQLILFLPIILLISIALQSIFDGFSAYKMNLLIPFVFLLFGALYQIDHIIKMPRGTSLNSLEGVLYSQGVQSLILAPCDFEPILHPEIRVKYNPLYRCGPKIFKTLDPALDRIAVWSLLPLDLSLIASYVKDFSSEKWFIQPYDGAHQFGNIGFLYIAIKK